MFIQRLSAAAFLSAMLLSGTSAFAQRAAENAATAASDAFGSSVGNERVGIYNPQSARSFSPIQAGNARIEGLYFDYQADIPERLISGSTMRVGLTAQSYPFPAPTGIADYTLRKAGPEPVLSVLASVGPYLGAKIELDGQLPVTETLGIAGGAGFFHEQGSYGRERDLITAAIIPRWRPSDELEIIPFWTLFNFEGLEGQPVIYTAGSYLPPEIKRREYFGQPWAVNDGTGVNYGAVSTYRSGGWTLRGGLFRSRYGSDWNFTNLFRNTTEDGMSDRFVTVERDRAFGSVSGELRLSRQFDEGDRRHIIHLAARGRDQTRRYGGGQTISVGRGRIDEVLEAPEPDFTFGPQTIDEVRQTTLGLGYEGRWRGLGELSLGIQKTDYRKDVEKPNSTPIVSKDDPWLLNGTLSVYATENLVFYGGYTRGLEESPVAPDNAVNRGEAPPAIRTEQMDAGLRYAFTDNLRLVTGLFEVKKPYFGVDGDRLFRNLGEVRHRGVEISLAGQIAPRLNAVIGAVLLDADVSGDAVEEGLVGRKPLGTFSRYINATLDYRVPGIEGLSFDLNYENTGDRVADRRNTYVIPERYGLNAGARYRFRMGDIPATLRAQAGMLTNVFGWVNNGDGFYYNPPRRLILTLIADV